MAASEYGGQSSQTCVVDISRCVVILQPLYTFYNAAHQVGHNNGCLLVTALGMLKNKAFVKKTKQGKVLKVVREHYLRDDIWSGSPLDPECDPSAHKLAADADHYLIIDTNVALQQVCVLCSSCAPPVLPSTSNQHQQHNIPPPAD